MDKNLQKRIPLVLVVDDECDFTDFLTEHLETAGLAVKSANTGHAALTQIKKERPDIVITDMVMPEMDGIEFAKNVIAIDPTINMISITGYPDWNQKLKDISDSIKVTLLKPIKMDDVIASIDICLAMAQKPMLSEIPK